MNTRMSTYTPLYSNELNIRLYTDNGETISSIFYSIKGLGMPAAQSTEAYSPGGYDKTYHLPTASQGGTLILRRPFEPTITSTTTTSAPELPMLNQWCEEGLRTQTFNTVDGVIYSDNGMSRWEMRGVYPKGIEYSTLGKGIEYQSTGRGEEAYGIVEEILTLGYAHINREY